MGFKYEINGSVFEFDREPTEEDIDEVANGMSQDSSVNILDQEPFATENVDEPHSVSKPSSGQEVTVDKPLTLKVLDNPFVKIPTDALSEIYRGFTNATGSMFRELDGATKLLNNTLSIPRSGAFEQFAVSSEYEANKIPETSLHGVDKAFLQVLGGAVPTTVQFAGSGLSTTGKMMVFSALREYEKEETLESLLKGAAEGATIDVAFRTAPVLLRKSIELLKRGGKSVARSFINFLTGDSKLANDFVTDPNKYALSPRKKIKSAKQIKAENDKIRRDIQDHIDITRDNIKVKHSAKRVKVQDDLQVARDNINNKNKQLLDEFKTGKAESVENTIRDSNSIINNSNQSLEKKTVQFLEERLDEFNSLKSSKGIAVKDAISKTIQKNPGASIPYSPVKNNAVKTIKQSSPFKPVGKVGVRKVEPRIKGMESSDVSTFNELWFEFRTKAEDGGLSIQYLQDLKNATRSLASKANSAGKNDLSRFYTKLSQDFNPAKIIENSESLSARYSLIGEANKAYATFMPRYERAMNLLFKKNAVGEYIPNINKPLSALVKNDRVFMKELLKADKALPANSKVFPRLKELLKDSESIVSQQKQLVRNIKKKAQVETKNIVNSINKEKQNLRRQQRFAKSDQELKLAQEKSSQLDSLINARTELDSKLVAIEDFHSQQDRLRSISPSFGTGAGFLQHILGFGALGSFKSGQIGATALQAGGVFALSPIGGASIVKGGKGIVGAIEKASRPIELLDKDIIRKTVGTRILRGK